MCIIHINDTINLFIISLETLFDKVFVHSFDGNVFFLTFCDGIKVTYYIALTIFVD